jgi:hypothetical protein
VRSTRRLPEVPEDGILTNDGAGNILRGWSGFPISILIALEEKSTRRALRFAEKSSEKRLALLGQEAGKL